MRFYEVALLCASVVRAWPIEQAVFRSPSAVDDAQLLDWSDEDRVIGPLRAHIAAHPEPRLLRVAHNGQIEDHWSTEGEKALLSAREVRFVDITDHRELWEAETPAVEAYDYPKELGYAPEDAYIASVKGNVSIARMTATLTQFSGFRTRYYRSETGRQSQQWLLGQIRGLAKQHPTLDIAVEEFEHSWAQRSIIARWPKHGSSLKKPDDGPIVILSAHQDSTNLLPFLSAPGADDDGSGTTTVLETFSALVANGFVPRNHSLEFHWYSAEEGGLLGSQDVAAAYAKRGQKVRAMLQMDMTAFVKPGTEPTVGVIQDFVDADLTRFVERIVERYTDIPVARTKCGYACSDHASWSKVGAPSAFTIESTFEDSNHAIHSTSDTINVPGFSFEHMRDFAYLAIGYILELTAPPNKS